MSESTDLLVRGGTVVDSVGTSMRDVAVRNGVIVEPDALSEPHVVDATGCIVSTGLVDMHAHLGEPGDEAAETMRSAGHAAVLGGFTTVLAMPDTHPAVDSAAVVDHVRSIGSSALCHVEVAGAITLQRSGKHLAPLGELAAAGVRYVTDAGFGLQNPLLMRRALEYCRPLGLTVGQPADLRALSAHGHMHEGEWSSRLGLGGAPAEAEEIMVMRDVSLARLTGATLHFQTLSSAGSLAIVGAAARAGVEVSAEVAAHHLLLTDSDLVSYDTNRKVWPPLRSSADVAAAQTAVESGVIDAIVSDHTPHTTDRKERAFDEAEHGTVGLETALAVALTAGISVSSALRALSWRPAELLGLGDPTTRSLSAGATADIVVFDPDLAITSKASEMATLGTNSAYEGIELTGAVRATIVAGRLVVEEGKVVA